MILVKHKLKMKTFNNTRINRILHIYNTYIFDTYILYIYINVITVTTQKT